MKTQDVIETLLVESRQIGTFTLQELLRAATDGNVSGLAVVQEPGKVSCLALISGEPEGAIYADEDGELYGDKAVIRIIGQDQFTLSEVKQDIVEALVMGCRIFEKSHLRQGITQKIPEIGMKSEGIGHLTIHILQDHEPQKGVRVSIRKDGKIVGSDFTSGDGSAGFRVMHGTYDCIVQDKNQQIRSFSLRFHETNQEITLEF
jgi:hypothetical protein